MSAIDNLVAHYKSKGQKLIEVPEWGDGEQPMKIFCEPITLFDMKKFMKLAKDDEVEMLVYVLIYKALDENGDKLFDLGDKNALLNSVDREILVSVATKIMGQEPIEETKKN